MPYRTETKIGCPYCGERISVVIDADDLEQEYIEDCQVCCRPITLVVSAIGDDGTASVMAYSENDTF